MARQGLASLELEDGANRARERLGVTIDQLRHNLAPTRLAEEWAGRSALKEMTADKILDAAARRHPFITLLAGAGFGLFAYSAVRRMNAYRREIDLVSNPLGQELGELEPPGRITVMASSLAESAAKAFRERAEAKSGEVMSRAKSQVTTGVNRLSGAVERKLEELLARIPGLPADSPFLASAVQLLLVTALQAALSRLSEEGASSRPSH